MQHADVIIVGGGPAGSACAARLVAAGLDVLVLDRARFPRDKACAGWITPEVVKASGLELHAYGLENTLQPIRRFRVGWIGGGGREVDYASAVSYGILRREFDSWLLRQSGRAQLPGDSLRAAAHARPLAGGRPLRGAVPGRRRRALLSGGAASSRARASRAASWSRRRWRSA